MFGVPLNRGRRLTQFLILTKGYPQRIIALHLFGALTRIIIIQNFSGLPFFR